MFPQTASCSAIADGFNGIQVHVANHDVMLCAVSRAPLKKLQAFKKRMGWTFPWASSFEGDFNVDFSVGSTEEVQLKGKIEYNYHREEPFKSPRSSAQNAYGTGGVNLVTYLRPGASAFIIENGTVYHAYSSYA